MNPGCESLHRSLIVVQFLVIMLDVRLLKLCSLELKLSLVWGFKKKVGPASSYGEKIYYL